MDRWKTMALAAVGAEPTPLPVFADKVPRCSEDSCPQYDGKRCKLMGFRPHGCCEPVIEAMADMAKTLFDDAQGVY